MVEGELHNNNKVTSKRHKTDEKAPILRHTFLNKYPDLKNITPLNPAPIQKNIGLIKKNQMLMEKVHHRFPSLVPTPKNSLSLCGALIFSFILVHTKLIRARN